MLLLALPMTAQKRKTPQPTPEQLEQQAKVERMTAKTQKVMFIDSMVVDTKDLLQAYRLTPEAGRIVSYQDVFRSDAQPHSYVNVNEMGNRCYFALEDTAHVFNLYTSEVIGNNWTRPTPLDGLNQGGRFTSVNYPYMMGDGQTFYFAAKGNEGLGGYDIYVTRYDADENTFLHPANIGMPFNSEANDYLYVIDEYNNLGWFATDRGQDEGKVCVYTFIPPTTRKTYSVDEYTAEQLASRARLNRIADTWDNRQELENALRRQHQAAQQKTTDENAGQFLFVINDEVAYTSLIDFKVQANRQHYKQLTKLQYRYQTLGQALEQARDIYATANNYERNELRSEILASEQKLHELLVDIRQLEKDIRNSENIHLTNNR